MKANQNDIVQSFLKVAKRITITILICIIPLVFFAYFTRNIITKDWILMMIFILFMGTAVLIEEIVTRKREARKQAVEELKPKKDVFK
ncbi:MAG: hypothetical protein E7374_01025 [Clostridiales bacterium]|nr:hypothetical protein [Clostridiales bacterium]